MTLSLVTSGVSLDCISITLAALNTGWWTNFGALIATIAVSCYNYYKRLCIEGYAILDANESAESLELRKVSVDLEHATKTAEVDLSYTDDTGIQGTSLKEVYLLEDSHRLSFYSIFHATTFNIFPKLSPTVSGLKLFLLFFVPSFIPTGRNSTIKTSREHHPTAYLDGVRRVSALSVIFCNSIWTPFTCLLTGWSGPSDSIFKFP